MVILVLHVFCTKCVLLSTWGFCFQNCPSKVDFADGTLFSLERTFSSTVPRGHTHMATGEDELSEGYKVFAGSFLLGQVGVARDGFKD